jgi:DNA-binding NarL/FixJ family response regulator
MRTVADGKPVNGASRPRAEASAIVISDVRVWRDAVGSALTREAAIDVLGSFERSQSALSEVAELRPQVALIDGFAVDALTFVRDMARVAPLVKVVILGVAEAENEILRYAEAGVSALVLRDASLEDLAATVRSVVGGECCCDPRVAAVLLRRVAALGPVSRAQERDPNLTAREREISEMVARGLSNKQIARELSVSVSTVKTHVHSLLEKLGVHRRSDVGARLHRLRVP